MSLNSPKKILSTNDLDPLYKMPNFFKGTRALKTRSSLLRAFHVFAEKNYNLNQNKTTDWRLATYNVHYWTDLYEKPAFDRIFEDLKKMNADVLCLQEVSFTPTRLHTLSYEELMSKFTQLGYTSAVEIRTQPYLGGDFGNMILSKLPISQQTSGLLDKGHGKVRRGYCSVHVDQLNLDICCVHLDVFDESGATRQRQLSQLMTLLGGARSNLVVMGDFNCTRSCDYSPSQLQEIINADKIRGSTTDLTTLQIFDQCYYYTCFEHGKVKPPNCTVWSCRSTDYIFLSKEFQYPITGCNPYYTVNSDHFPIYMDLKAK
jgi:endonuclease/exonuclease/phosphatase family metal-dependent hydrolase